MSSTRCATKSHHDFAKEFSSKFEDLEFVVLSPYYKMFISLIPRVSLCRNGGGILKASPEDEYKALKENFVVIYLSICLPPI